jgi:raffinose/stachyose/melibiose transport system substrate-binding protein
MKKIFFVLALCMAATAGLSAEQPIRLKWLHHISEDSGRQWVDKTIAEFTKSHPNVSFEVSAVGFDSYMQQLKLKIASGDAPDLFDVDQGINPNFIEQGFLADLSKEPFWGNVQDFAKQGMTWSDGKIYGFQSGTSFFGAFYNKDVFAKAGIKNPPVTWDEFVADLEKIKKIGVAPVASPYKEWWTMACAMHSIKTQAIAPLNHDWQPQLEARTITFSDDKVGFSDILKKMLVIYNYSQKDAFGTDWNQAQDMLVSGQAGIIINGDWTASSLRMKSPNINLGFFLVPYSNDATKNKLWMRLTPGGMSVFDKSPNKAMAKQFVAYLASPQSAKLQVAITKNISTIKNVPTESEPSFDILMDYQKQNKILGNGAASFQGDFGSENIKIFYDTVSEYLLDSKHDTAATLKKLDAAFDKTKAKSAK